MQKTTTVTKALRTLSPAIPLSPALKSVTLVLNSNVHATARKFMKKTLPRVAYSNPHVTVKVEDLRNSERDGRPELQLDFGDGRPRHLPINHKQPSQVIKMLVEASGRDVPQDGDLQIEVT